MNTLPFNQYEPTEPTHLQPGVWLSLDDHGTTVQRLGVIVPNDTIVDQMGVNALTVIHYDGLQQPTNEEEILKNYHSRKLMFTLLDGNEWGGTQRWTIDGPLVAQPAPAAPVEDGPGPEDLSPFAEAIYSQLPPPSRKTPTYETFISKYGSGSMPEGYQNDYGVKRMKGKPFNFGMSGTPPFPGLLKQVVVIDEQGGRIVPYAMVPEGYVRVDLYNVFSKVDAPVVEDVPEDNSLSLTQILRGQMEQGLRDVGVRTPPVLSLDQPNPFVGMDSATGPDQTAYVIAKVGKDGTVSYMEAPESLHELIDFKLSTPSKKTDQPDGTV